MEKGKGKRRTNDVLTHLNIERTLDIEGDDQLIKFAVHAY